MAYDSGLIDRGKPFGYERYIDASELCVAIMRHKMNKPDFNEGQKTVFRNTSIQADTQVYWEQTYTAFTGTATSNVMHNVQEVRCPHEEAISEAIADSIEEAEYAIQQLYRYNYTFPIGSGADAAVARNTWWGMIIEDALGLFI